MKKNNATSSKKRSLSPPPFGRLIVIHSYKKAEGDEITLKKGEVVIGLRITSTGWYEGRNTLGEVGYFPQGCVAAEGSKKAKKCVEKIERKKTKVALAAASARNGLPSANSHQIPLPTSFATLATPVNTRVRIQTYAGHALNGRTGIVTDRVARGRLGVRLDDGRSFLVLPQHLYVLSNQFAAFPTANDNAVPSVMAAVAADSPTRNCSICFDSFDVTSLIAPSSQCTHTPQACDECLRQHIAEEVGGKGITRIIVCPSPGCREPMEHHDIGRVCRGSADGRLMFERFDNLLTRRSLEQMPDFTWCKGPQCGSGQLHVGGNDTNVMRCGACHAKTCVIHQLPHHDGISCTDFDGQVARNARTALNRVWEQQNTKPCPSCNGRIQKNLGCCHMTCANVEAHCTHQFCWHCLAPWHK